MTHRTAAITTLARLGWSQRQIAQAVGLSQPGVLKVLRRIGQGSPVASVPQAETVPAAARDNQTPERLSVAAAERDDIPLRAETLDELLGRAFLHGLCITEQGTSLRLHIPEGFPPRLREELKRYTDSLLSLTQHKRRLRVPCSSCGNRLLCQVGDEVSCPHCHGVRLNWVWAGV